jgi:hypothetical protein
MVISRLNQAALVVGGVFIAVLSSFLQVSASPFSGLNIDPLGRGGGTHGLVACAGQTDNLLWNASGLGYSRSSEVAVGYMDYLVTVGGGTACYTGVGKGLGYGIHASYLSSDTYARTGTNDQVGQGGETFKYGDIVLGVSAGRQLLPWVAVGTGIKFARYELADVAGSGLAADLSGTVRLYPLHGAGEPRTTVFVSAVTRNLALATWQADESDMPRHSEIGLGLGFPGNGLVTGLSAFLGENGRREMRFGLTAMPSREFEIRLGYRRRVGKFSDAANDLAWERGILAGFGIGFGRFWVDYTFEDASPLDNIHRFALRAKLAHAEASSQPPLSIGE